MNDIISLRNLIEFGESIEFDKRFRKAWFELVSEHLMYVQDMPINLHLGFIVDHMFFLYLSACASSSIYGRLH